MRTVDIFVIEIDGFSVNNRPVRTKRTFNEDLSEDYFICPFCKSKVSITHWKDSRGEWPDVDLQCKKCGKHWGILL